MIPLTNYDSRLREIIWYILIGPIVIPWEKDASRATTHEGLEEFGKE